MAPLATPIFLRSMLEKSVSTSDAVSDDDVQSATLLPEASAAEIARARQLMYNIVPVNIMACIDENLCCVRGRRWYVMKACCMLSRMCPDNRRNSMSIVRRACAAEPEACCLIGARAEIKCRNIHRESRARR